MQGFYIHTPQLECIYYRMWLGMKSSTIYCVYVSGEYSEKLWISWIFLMISMT